MLLHVVLLRLRPDADPAAVRRVEEDVRGLVAAIDGVRAVRWGANVSPEGLGAGHDLGFAMELDDAAARDRYLVHPAHLPVAAALPELTDGVLVFDLDDDAG